MRNTGWLADQLRDHGLGERAAARRREHQPRAIRDGERLAEHRQRPLGKGNPVLRFVVRAKCLCANMNMAWSEHDYGVDETVVVCLLCWVEQPDARDFHSSHRGRHAHGGTPDGVRVLAEPGFGGGELLPEISSTGSLRRAESAVQKRVFVTAQVAMGRIVALQEEHRLEPVPEDDFRYPKVWAAAGDQQRTQQAVMKYLQLLGRGACNYRRRYA